MPRTLVLRPSAKINLTLRVGTQRADGFHDVRTMLQSISLCDRLTMTGRPGPFVLTTNAADVPVGRGNLVYRAAEVLWRAAGRRGAPRDAAIALDKRIPVAAGLGGGSADAAAALAGLNELWRTRLPRPALMRLGAALGADVPFLLHGGTALGTGRGDELCPVDDVSRLALVVIKPAFGVSAADAYRWFDEDDGTAARSASATKRRGDEIDVGWPGGPIALGNDLQATVARRHPEIQEMVSACRRAGARGAAMTGSGSAVFAVFAETDVRGAQRRLSRRGWQVLSTHTCRRRDASRRLGL